MKQLITLLIILCLFGSIRAVCAENGKNELMNSDSVVWAGLDYSMLHIVGDMKYITVPDMFFQDMPAKWNDLFLDERLEGVAKSLNKHVFIDIGGVTQRNANALINKNIFQPDTQDALERVYTTPKEISDAVVSCKMEHTNGLGLVFIVDGMFYHKSLKPATAHSNSANSYLYTYAESINVVFFDIATRKIISTRREMKTVGTGGSYRFFWFGPIKDVDSGLSDYR